MLQKEILVYSPVDGVVKDLEKVDDEVFSKKMVGDGMAIVPQSDVVYSPIKGKIITSFHTGHAFGIKTKKNGPQLLVHIGVDTVDLEGKGFRRLSVVDEKVTKKNKLSKIDLPFIEKEATASDVILAADPESMKNYKIEFVAQDEQTVKSGDLIFKFVKK